MSETSSQSSNSDNEQLEVVLKQKTKNVEVPEERPKRKYNRKPQDEETKQIMRDKMAKARASRQVNIRQKKLEKAQEDAEIVELKKMKDEGQLTIKPKRERKQKIVKEIHHYHEVPVVVPIEKKIINKVKEPPSFKMVFA